MKPAAKDGIVIAIVLAAAFWITREFELAKMLKKFMRAHENWQLDEITIVLMVLSLLLVFFAFRRRREALLEIADRKRAEAKLQRRNRAFQILSGSNQALIRSTEERDLLQKVCRLLVEVGEYRFAWVGFAGMDEEKTVLSVAQWGEDEGFLNGVIISWEDNKWGQCPVGRAIRNREPAVVVDVRTDPLFEVWKDEAIKAGFGSCIALPLLDEDKAYGAITVYAGEADAFDAEETKILTELSDDLAFGIRVLRAKEAHKLAESELEKLSDRRQAMAEMGALISRAKTTREAAQVIAEAALKLGDADAAHIFLRGEDDFFQMEAESTSPLLRNHDDESCVRFRPGEGLTGAVAESGERIVVDNVRKDPRWVETPWSEQWEFGSFAAMPIKRGEETIGVFSLMRLGFWPFGEEVMESITLLAIYASISLENIYWLDEERARTARLEITDKIAKSAGSTLEPREIFKSIVTEIRRAVPCDRVLIGNLNNPEYGSYMYLFEEEGDSVEPMSGYRGRAGLISRKVYETKQPFNIPDLQIDAWRESHHTKLGFRSALIVPIIQDGRSVAHVHLSSKQPHFFSKDNEALLTDIAAHLGPALRNANLYHMAEERASRLIILNELNREITENLNLEEVLDQVVQAVVELLKGNIARIFLVEEDTETLFLQSSGGDIPAPPDQGISFKRGEGIIGRMLQTGDPVIDPDIQQNPDWITNEWVNKYGLHSYIAHPLMQEGRVIGVINCMAKEKEFFSPGDLDLLGSLASQAAIAIKNAETHSRLEKSFEELRQSKQMVARAERLSSLGTLTAGAAHEILNPANIIGLHGQRLLWESAEGTEERESAEEIVRNVKRISRICDDLRRFSRNEAPQNRPFDPNQTAQDCLRPLENEIRLQNILTEVNLSEETQIVTGDQNQMEQVLFNLINNAMDAMPGGGTLTLASQTVREENGEWWELRVADTGEGIPEDVMEKVFDPFFTTKPQEKGTGLGLSVSYGIVDAHNGKLWAESTLGKGTTFFMQLPLKGE